VNVLFFRPLAHSRGFKHCTSQGMTATASNRSQTCWGRRPHFRFGGLLTTAETERWILWVRQWLLWPVCQFSGQAQWFQVPLVSMATR